MKNKLLVLLSCFLLSCSGAGEKTKNEQVGITHKPEVTEQTLEPKATSLLDSDVHSEKPLLASRNIGGSAVSARNRHIQNSITDLFRLLEPKKQAFRLQPTKDTVLIGEQGTRISIPAHSLVYQSSGQEVKEEVEFTLKEFYKLSDMVLANLSTTSNGEILETGGMIHLEARANGHALEVKEGVLLKLEFPYEQKQEDMRLWYGSWNEDQINWEPADTLNNTSERVFESSQVDELPQFPGGSSVERYFNRKLIYPSEALANGIQGTVFITFVVRETGKIDSISILRGVHPTLDNEAIRAIEGMPNWIPGKKDGIKVSTTMSFPIIFRPSSVGYTDDESFKQDFENNMDDEQIHSSSSFEINRYIFSTSRLGWINVDKILDTTNPRIKYIIDLPYNRSTTLKLVLRDYQSILDFWLPEKGKFTFDGVPINLYAKIVALKYEDERMYIATKDIQVKRDYSPELQFTEVSMEKLKEIIEEINHYSR